MTTTPQPRRTTTLREIMADGTTVELSVALDECGVPVSDLALPEAMYDELNRGWSAFARASLEAEVAGQLTKPVEPKRQTAERAVSHQPATFGRLLERVGVEEDEDKEELILSLFGDAVALYSVLGMLVSVASAAVASMGILLGVQEVWGVLVASMGLLVVNPWWWCFSIDGLTV